MPTITTIGLGLAKKVIQVHGVDAEGNVVVTSPATARPSIELRRARLPVKRLCEGCRRSGGARLQRQSKRNAP
jgi:hypothetical protein